MNNPKIFRLSSGDAVGIASLQSLSPGRPWSINETQKLLTEETIQGWGIKEGETLQGFILVRIVKEVVDILDFAVLTECRRQGLGKKLYDHLESIGKQKQIKEIFLEVASSNRGALLFYTNQGFKKEAIRKNYYTFQGVQEDGILMRKIINL
jgi:ribosomal-protein-alanine N-acetyltransferase